MTRLARYAVPILFAVLCLAGILVAKITPSFLLSEMLVRVGRNTVLVLLLRPRYDHHAYTIRDLAPFNHVGSKAQIRNA